ncbi:MAG: nucleoside hydrolase [Anaerolineae bacterium]|nr:nucleoside hydrolase [Anaerolineae bacterium]
MNTNITLETVKVIVDTDTGVDDAAAIAWLLSQTKYEVAVLGITTVNGNTDARNAANNVLTVMDAVGRRDIPVLIGADKPLLQDVPKTGSLMHGPDGLWFVGQGNPHDLERLSDDVPEFLCSNAAADVKLIALGPLTNIAQAYAHCPERMRLYSEIVVLGGAKYGGNISATAEFNFWADPEAVEQVLCSGLNLRIIPMDTFDTFTLSMADIDRLMEGTAVAQLLSPALKQYAAIQLGLGGAIAAGVPDVTAVMIALDEQLLIEEQPALVKIMPGGVKNPQRLVRGQSIIGLNMAQKVPMIAAEAELNELALRTFTEPGFNLETELDRILEREPDNAHIILDIDEKQMHHLFMHYLMTP